MHELRLQRAHALLTDAQHSRERISDIALRAGFSDISHSTAHSAAVSAIRRAASALQHSRVNKPVKRYYRTG